MKLEQQVTSLSISKRLKGKHRCCLCGEPAPQEKQGWEERFRKEFYPKEITKLKNGGISHPYSPKLELIIDFIRRAVSAETERCLGIAKNNKKRNRLS